MRSNWALPALMVLLLAASAAPASACIPGMPEQEFEAQAVSSGTAFPDLAHLSATTVDELFPQAIRFRDRLFVAWQREDFNETVKYFVTLTSFDGTSWSDNAYLSSPDITRMVRSELNLNPRMGVDGDRAMYVVWTSNEPNWTTGIDDDVVFRYTEDGEEWSEVIEVTGHYNEGLDKLARVTAFQNRVWFLWETNDDVDSEDGDMDIVMRPWKDGEMGQVLEVTLPGDKVNDHYVEVAADGSYMYVVWQSMNYSSGMGGVHDVYGRVFDGRDWVTPPMKLNSDAGLDNEHATVVAADGSCYFLWQTQDTGKTSDPSSVVIRRWSPGSGLGPRSFVSSLTSNGKDSHPTALWWEGQLYVAWISMDQGVTFGRDADLIFRAGRPDESGHVRFGNFEEVSVSTDDYEDRYPRLVVYDDIVNVVWVVDTNYTDLVPPEVVEKLGGVVRSRDVVIQSIHIPFEKSLGMIYTLGTAFPVATKPTTAKVTISDLQAEPMSGLKVILVCTPLQRTDGRDHYVLLKDKGNGEYVAADMEFPLEGPYDVGIIVNDVRAGSFVVDVVPPPPSFVDRVPLASLAFVMAAGITGTVLYRGMGRDEMVHELRPAPLEATSQEVAS